ncbi:type I restriction endonuclease subunit R [Propioniciclava coleopterorum]|uniref:Type I restriction enzyme endonuclease subunit n=1 Tax=Propioniciclava coleopterorum TaxID=2714937 RepID=A0A6G7Y735_9ACTN|nr:type I restriction endonuclease subunit R [Propioniciclava coleopterorum]QIK72600.1 type I restriction endonuclease subunit R [Propioniciclava coleopterorum]
MLESEWEATMLDWLADLDWRPGKGQEFEAQRSSLGDLAHRDDFLAALRKLNPEVPDQYLAQAASDVLVPASQDAPAENKTFHDYLVHGYRGVTFVDATGSEQNPTLRLLSASADENDLLAVQQVRLIDKGFSRRFDVVLYVNGLPLVVVELKQAGSKQATVAKAHSQLCTYLHEFPLAFRTVVATVISDGLTAQYGTPFTPLNHYSPWKVDEHGVPLETGPNLPELEALTFGLLAPDRFLDIALHYTAFDEKDGALTKRIAKPHQYFAVRKAVASTVRAVDSNGKAGVVWHTQGSGKSMEMELYANLVMTHPRLLNPTLVVITDRTELDGQLYETFARSTLLADTPQQVKTRSGLRAELTNRNSGGILFTTLQKFGRNAAERDAGDEHPLLTERRNVIVIVDEAHRSHYDDLDGYARHLKDALPNATLIAFTGTPISQTDRNTREVFGDYIDIYDLSRAVDDGATVPVTFEPRLIQVKLADDVSADDLDRIADEQGRGLDLAERERIEKSVAVINAIYGAPERIEALARDIVTHWEARRLRMAEALANADATDGADAAADAGGVASGSEVVPHGKAMIVGATREICARLYTEIVALRPEWHSDDLDKGRIKVVYSGNASDVPPIRDHVRRDSENAVVKERLKNIEDELELVIVKDMMLTGYDSPPLHTLYLDRPLKGALLMQTLARVNRTYRGKQDGLLVAYAPLADNLRAALAEYTDTDQASRPVGKTVDEAAAAGIQLIEALRGLLAGFGWKTILGSNDPHRGRKAVAGAVEYLRSPLTPGNQVAGGELTLGERYRILSAQLGRIWALASGAESWSHLKSEVRFYEEVRVWMAKYDAKEREASGEPIPEEILRVLRGVVADATATGDITDIYSAAGIPRPTLGALTPAMLDQVQRADHPHLAIEALRDLLMQEARHATAGNVVRTKAFSERITELMNRYTNQQLTAAEVLAELANLIAEVSDEGRRGDAFDPPLSHDELAFYDAVSQNDSAVLLQGEDVLAQIARELVAVMRRDTRTDWTRRPDVQAKLRSEIKRLLRRYKYPPDKQQGAVTMVLEQMELMAHHGPAEGR